ncbi:hypothetical protein AB6A40_009788 [Gnathostoma spinigerum]|uniref:Uncharacterized protein n=1 Tax=Gnathostoma spinigerum TaxID=75299 RepID=A0ABD6EY48_9BILA
MRRLLLLPLLLLLFVFQYSAGFLSSLWSSTSQVKNETKSSATDHSENADSLCLRMHNNTAFLGTNPISKLNLPSAFDCKELCIDIYPKCKAGKSLNKSLLNTSF